MSKVTSPVGLARVVLTAMHSLSAHVTSWHVDADLAGTASGERAESANKWVVLAVAGGAALMTSLDSSIVNIALPSIAHGFHVPLSGAIEWVLDGYLVVIAATLLTFGRLADVRDASHSCSAAWRCSRLALPSAAPHHRSRRSSPRAASRAWVRQRSFQ